MRTLTTAAAIAMLCGCAASTSIEQATPTPHERLFATQQSSTGAEAQITVFREGVFGGSACYLGIYVDGELVARMDANEKSVFRIRSGKRLVGVGVDPQGRGVCAGRAGFKQEVATLIEPGEKQTFRIPGDGTLNIRQASY
ncbi:hypothetical protein [Pseudomonas putida]|uniref:hypothetical protein n=1 Tax=Pseudomonas putida TaxID=303 RepID=UPI0018A8B15A|nr:hypothetical protein [Pseudomonas putida]MBF8726943.1 hypothetical protein [Pseudomonas putida]